MNVRDLPKAISEGCRMFKSENFPSRFWLMKLNFFGDRVIRKWYGKMPKPKAQD